MSEQAIQDQPAAALETSTISSDIQGQRLATTRTSRLYEVFIWSGILLVAVGLIVALAPAPVVGVEIGKKLGHEARKTFLQVRGATCETRPVGRGGRPQSVSQSQSAVP